MHKATHHSYKSMMNKFLDSSSYSTLGATQYLGDDAFYSKLFDYNNKKKSTMIKLYLL